MTDHAAYQHKRFCSIQLIGKEPGPFLDWPRQNGYTADCPCMVCDQERATIKKKLSAGLIHSRYSRYDQLDPREGSPDETAYLLSPYRVYGFSLRNKERSKNLDTKYSQGTNKEKGSLKVVDLAPVRGGQRGFNRLVLDHSYMDIVQALVRSYTNKTSDFRDLVTGKGQGLVALLHGVPGTGKTLTAGVVANLALDAFLNVLWLTFLYNVWLIISTAHCI